MRLIDADELIKNINNGLSFDQDTLDREGLYDVIEATKTIDPVVHGRWINPTEPNEYKNIESECSVCHAGELHAINILAPFCWHCGAKMDKEEDDDRD